MGNSFLDVIYALPSGLPLGHTAITLQTTDLQGQTRRTRRSIELTRVRSMTFAHGPGHVAGPAAGVFGIPLSLQGTQHPGIHVRVHFDSRRLEWVGGVTPLSIGALAGVSAVQPDSFDLDGDPSTDVLVDLLLAVIQRGWQPLEFGSGAILRFRSQPMVDGAAVTQVRFTAGATGSAVDLVTAPVHVLAGVSLDIDGDGQTSALKDGLLFARWLAGLRGEDLVRDALGTGALRTDPLDLGLLIRNGGATGLFDIDDSRDIALATDGQLLVRWLFGFRETSLTRNAVAEGAFRTAPWQVEGFLAPYDP